MTTRKENEKKFGNWTENPDGSRRYWYIVQGKHGWLARYVKEVNVNEVTISFYQEIYNTNNELVEIHKKYPKR
ncbi:MAG: hypothetical protein M1480_07715 [Bacteroidetes bacterium]|nr:hypothetical protein [Bacteroidota bacterium]